MSRASERRSERFVAPGIRRRASFGHPAADSYRRMVEDTTALYALVDIVQDAVVISDPLGHILRFNPAAEALFGYQAYEILGRSVDELVGSDPRRPHDEPMARFVGAGAGPMVERRRRVIARHRSGRSIAIDMWVNEATHGGQRLFLGVMRPVDGDPAVAGHRRRSRWSTEEVTLLATTVLQDIDAKLRTVSRSATPVDTEVGTDALTACVRAGKTRLEELLRHLTAIEETAGAEEIDIAALVDEIRQTLVMPAGFSVELAGALSKVRTAKLPLRCVLQTFVGLAVARHNPRDGGRVQLQVESEREYYRFSLDDDGPGLPAQAYRRGRLPSVDVLRELLGPDADTLIIADRIVRGRGGRLEITGEPCGLGNQVSVVWPKASTRIN